MGPTASGKTDLAERLADELDAQLLNADAFQIYRGMDVGTAKPADRARYRLLDLKDPDEPFGVGEYVRLAQQALAGLYTQGRSAVVVGGTGLYVRALFEEYAEMSAAPDPRLREELNAAFAAEGLAPLVERLRILDPETAERVDLRNPARVKRALERALAPTPAPATTLPPFAKLKVGLHVNPQDLELRIEQRVSLMVQNGWVQEVQRLMHMGYSLDAPGFRAIGYRAISEYLLGKVELEEAVTTAIVDTRRYAKRQRTWLRSEPNLTALPLDTDVLSAMRERIGNLFV